MLISMLLATTLAAQQISSCEAAPRQAETRAVVRILENAWNEAHVHGDTAFLRCMLDPNFVGVDAKGNVFHREQEFAGALAAAKRGVRYNPETAPTPTIFIHDHLAISTGVVPKVGSHGEHGARWTDIYRYDGMHWHAIYSGATAF